MSHFKLYSWNVNGLRAVYKKGFLRFLENHQPDIIALQEIKATQDQLPSEILNINGYQSIFNPAKRKGYSGTAVYTKLSPNQVDFGIKHLDHDDEGRVITVHFDKFIFVNVYTPNSKRNLERLEERQTWDKEFTKFLLDLESTNHKPIICCGDLNVAHQEIDLARPKQNTRNAGFTQEERQGIQRHIQSGFIDTFRHLNPQKKDSYTWWSYQNQSRQRNVGWRIDYFLSSKAIITKVKSTNIYPEVHGSDHCPISINLNI